MTFSGITREQFVAIQKRLAQETGVSITADQGTEVDLGFTIVWNYIESIELLTVDCTKKPWYVAESVVDAQIIKLVQGS